ncbi:MAG TPA: hypothetical protein VJ965_07160 [Anaerolineales bacterium]|nr:hypothetical protein [Anaerolineales bacterium]
MKQPKKITKLFKWVLRGGLIGLPLALSSTLALGQRLTWVGAVLLWFYTGRVLRQRETQDDQTPQINSQN